MNRLRQSSCFEAVVFTSERTGSRERGTRLYNLYERLDAALFRGPSDAFASVPLTETPRPVSELRDYDVVLDLGPSDASSALASATRYGAWILTYRDDHDRVLEPPLFWETYRRSVYRLQLEAQLANGERRLLYRTWGAPDSTSLQRGRNRAYGKVQGAIFDQLASVAQGGDAYLESRTPLDSRMTDETEVPSAPILVRHAAQTAVGVLTKRLRRLLYRNEWFVAARPFVSPAPCEQLASLRDHPFIPIDAPRGASFADPFPFEDDGQIYLFVEELRAPDPRGVISCLLLDDSVRPAGPVREVLRRPYHLSYPFVFRHGGDIFMIPESSENSSVELYRATAFPTAWTLEEVLFRGINAVDATLFEDGGRMWLFMTVAEGGFAPTENLHVYHADRLSGPWQPHLRNPVVTDVRSARSAGRLYRRRGELIRPSQDNSRQYGYALVFNRIERLTPEEYHEREIARLDPTWLPRLTATHTYNYTEKVEAIDGRRPMLKPPFDLVRRRARS